MSVEGLNILLLNSVLPVIKELMYLIYCFKLILLLALSRRDNASLRSRRSGPTELIEMFPVTHSINWVMTKQLKYLIIKTYRL